MISVIYKRLNRIQF